MSEQKNHLYEFGPFRLDLRQRVLLRDGEPVSITPKAFETLLVLVENSSDVVGKDTLIEKVWPDVVVEESTLAQNISALRKVLGKAPFEREYIQTIPKRGYRFSTVVKAIDGTTNIPIATPSDELSKEKVDGPWLKFVVWNRAVPWSITVIVVLAALLVIWKLSGPKPGPVSKLVITTPRIASLGNRPANDLAISPDGRRIVYAAQRPDGGRQLYVRYLDRLEATPIAGTEGVMGSPSFSGDSQSVLFVSARRELKRIPIEGGPAVILHEDPGVGGHGSWGSDDTIIFPLIDRGLFLISADGGEPEVLTTPEQDKGERHYGSPQLLPGGEAVIFTVLHSDGYRIAVLSLETGEKKTLVEGARGARYAPTGHLVYETERTGTLMAVPFDVTKVQVTGTPVLVLEGIRHHHWPIAMADYAFSANGTLIYVPKTQSVEHQLVWVDREGNELLLSEEPRNYGWPRISPDGKQLAFVIFEKGGFNVWIYDLGRDSLRRLTLDGERNGSPEWSPDGKWIVFSSNRDGPQNMHRKRADGRGSVERLTKSEVLQVANSWLPDGSGFSFNVPSEGSTWILPVGEDQNPHMLMEGEGGIRFSPDGRWLAYAASEKGQPQVYVRSYAEPDIRWLVSGDEGGFQPAWFPDGSELSYRSGDKMMLLPVETEPSFSAGKPRVLFDKPYVSTSIGAGYNQYYDVSTDGQQFLMIKEAEGEGAQINVVLNWFEELKRLVPTN